MKIFQRFSVAVALISLPYGWNWTRRSIAHLRSYIRCDRRILGKELSDFQEIELQHMQKWPRSWKKSNLKVQFGAHYSSPRGQTIQKDPSHYVILILGVIS